MEKQPGITFKEYRALAVTSRAAGQFKDPTIVRCKDGDWFISYYFRRPDDPGKWKAFKERCGLNYIKDLQNKEKEAEVLRIDVLNWLLAGNSPFNNRKVTGDI